MKAHESQARMLLGINHAFAENGWGTTWEQYMIKERLEYVITSDCLEIMDNLSSASDGILTQSMITRLQHRVRGVSPANSATRGISQTGLYRPKKPLAWCDKTRVAEVKLQWMTAIVESIKQYHVSVDCPSESNSSNRLLQPDQELHLYLDPAPEACTPARVKLRTSNLHLLILMTRLNRSPQNFE